jgi:mono/diheme cytochrome c family protein
MRVATWRIGTLLLALLGTRVVPGSDEPAPVDPVQSQARSRARELFRQRVYPTLQARCLGCHGDGEELEGALDLRSRDAMLQGGKNGAALVPGNPLASPIYQSVRRTDEKMMPPKDKERLTPEEIAALKTWIEAGAPWDMGD